MITSRRYRPVDVNVQQSMQEAREHPAGLHWGLLPVGHEEGGKAHLSHLLGLQGPGMLWKDRPEGWKAVPWSVSVLVSVLQQLGREGTAKHPPFCPGKKVSPSPPLFLFARSVPPPPHPPVSGAATLQLFYPSVSDSEVLSKAPAVSARCSHKRPL